MVETGRRRVLPGTRCTWSAQRWAGAPIAQQADVAQPRPLCGFRLCHEKHPTHRGTPNQYFFLNISGEVPPTTAGCWTPQAPSSKRLVTGLYVSIAVLCHTRVIRLAIVKPNILNLFFLRCIGLKNLRLAFWLVLWPFQVFYSLTKWSLAFFKVVWLE